MPQDISSILRSSYKRTMHKFTNGLDRIISFVSLVVLLKPREKLKNLLSSTIEVLGSMENTT